MASADWLKLTSPHAAGMEKHLDAAKRLTVNHSNTDIDKTKSHLNLIIGCITYSEALQAMRQRVKDVDKLYPPLKRKKADERVIAEMIEVKCPAEIVSKGYDSVCDYFKGIYKIQQEFFGAENVHGGFVHFDEMHEYTDKDGEKKTSLPHMHTLVSCYCEWTENDKKTGVVRNRKGINGKNFEKRPRYNQLNKMIDEYCLMYYGITYTKGKGKEAGYGKSVEELKANEKVNKLTALAKEKESQRIREQQLLSQAHHQRISEEMKATALQADISDKQQTLADLKDNIEQDYSMHKKLKKTAKKYYDIAVSAKEEAERINAMISEIERIKTEYLQMKADFLNFINEETLKIKSETERDKIKKRVESEIRSRDEINAELDSFLNEIMQNRPKEKQRSF